MSDNLDQLHTSSYETFSVSELRSRWRRINISVFMQPQFLVSENCFVE